MILDIVPLLVVALVWLIFFGMYRLGYYHGAEQERAKLLTQMFDQEELGLEIEKDGKSRFFDPVPEPKYPCRVYEI